MTEAGTGEKRQAVAMDTFFANPYYKIGFSGSKKYFKPGFPYTLGVSVSILPKINSVLAASSTAKEVLRVLPKIKCSSCFLGSIL